MNTILFFSGMGCGALVAVVLLMLLIRLWKSNNAEQRHLNDESLRLLKERNQIDAQCAKGIGRIADAIEEAAGR